MGIIVWNVFHKLFKYNGFKKKKTLQQILSRQWMWKYALLAGPTRFIQKWNIQHCCSMSLNFLMASLASCSRPLAHQITVPIWA